MSGTTTGADPGGGGGGVHSPPKIGKNMIFWRKIVNFHTKKKKQFMPPSARRNFFKYAPSLTWNPGSAPVLAEQLLLTLPESSSIHPHFLVGFVLLNPQFSM